MCAFVCFHQLFPNLIPGLSRLIVWPHGLGCLQGDPGAAPQTDQSWNHAPPTEINTHFLSSLSHWFFPHSLNLRTVATPAQRKWQTTSRDSHLLWQERSCQLSRERETFEHSAAGLRVTCVSFGNDRSSFPFKWNSVTLFHFFSFFFFLAISEPTSTYLHQML